MPNAPHTEAAFLNLQQVYTAESEHETETFIGIAQAQATLALVEQQRLANEHAETANLLRLLEWTEQTKPGRVSKEEIDVVNKIRHEATLKVIRRLTQ